MRKALFVVASFALCTLEGCVYSIHPLYTEGDVTFDLGLAGTWAEPGSSEKVQFIPADDSAYVVILTDEDGNEGRFTGRLFSLAGLTFLDFFPKSPNDEGSEAYRDHFLPVHSVMAAYRDGSRLELRFLDYEALEDYLETHASTVGFTEVDANIVLTSTTEELRGFFAEFLSTAKPLGDKGILYRMPMGL